MTSGRGRTGEAFDETPDDDQLLDTIGVAFSKMRRRTTSVPVGLPSAATDLRRDMLLSLIDSAAVPLNVQAVATALMLDQSAASRLTSWCVQQGLLERVASQTDGRIITFQLTPAGHDTLEQSRRQQREAFEIITAAWPRHERMTFARLLHKYAASAEAASNYQ